MLKNTPLCIIYILLFNSCSNVCDDLHVNVEDIKVNLKIEHMEKDIFSSSNTSFQNKHQFLLDKYGALYQSFFAVMINEGDPYNNNAHHALEQFITDSNMNLFNNEIIKAYNNFEPVKIKLDLAFKHYSYYFPDSTLPIITTFYSNFNANVFEIDNRLGIGLEMYLGTENSLIKKLPNNQLPQYMKDKMNQQYLISDIMHRFLQQRFYKPLGDDFISTIISIGKVMYLLDAILPNEAGHIKMGYSIQEYQWCKENELNIWETIVDQDLIYTKDQTKVMSFLNEGPFTKGLPYESPSRVGVWLGLQIIKDHVNKNCIEVLDLLKENNIQTILKSYNPNE